jgi:hypothetical protein
MARKVKKEVPEVVNVPEVKDIVAPLQEGPRKVKVTPEELARLQGEKRLIGYDPLTCEATIL